MPTIRFGASHNGIDTPSGSIPLPSPPERKTRYADKVAHRHQLGHLAEMVCTVVGIADPPKSRSHGKRRHHRGNHQPA